MNNTKPRIWLLGSEFVLEKEISKITTIEGGGYEPYHVCSSSLMTEY